MAPKRGRLGRHSAAGASTPLPPPSTDVLFEILSWLPLRFLIRCRCVCKSWRALISNPAFVAVHRSHAKPLLVALTVSPYWRALSHTLQIMDAEGDVARLVKLNSLYKFRASLDSLVFLTSMQDASVRVIDLATEETIASCQCPRPDTWVAYTDTRLATWFGFGRAARSGELKVIYIFFGDRLACQVLTLGDNGGSGWRQTPPPPSDMTDDLDDGVEVNGALHFLSIRQDHILGFDRGVDGDPRTIRNYSEPLGENWLGRAQRLPLHRSLKAVYS
jgi:hypothetical protein